jgi:hypothetical protein
MKTCHNTSLLEEITVATQHYISSPAVPGPEGNILTTPPLSPAPASNSFDESKLDSHAISCNPPLRTRRRWNCAERHCSCCCHRTAKTAGRFWAFNYTPLDVFRQTCNNKSCNAINYGGAFSFALSPFGIWWSATIQFHVLAAQGKFSLRPPLELERIVPYTSPGFETLWRWENNLITFEEARDRLVNLKRSDRTFKNHVNPGGKSYIEVRIFSFISRHC